MTDPIDYANEYDNSGRVPNADELKDNYVLDAALYREQRDEHSQLGRTYGKAERNRLDIFWPDDGQPTENQSVPIAMFIHGGYWQYLDRSVFSHMAAGLNANGIAVAIPSYTLCPDISIAGIINEMRRACVLLYQTYKQTMTVFGHSAGGHLAACMMATDWRDIHPDLPDDLVHSGMGISGVYDLAPLTQTPLNSALKLDDETANASSPLFWLPDGLNRFEAWVGGDESSEFHRQSSTLADRWTMAGTPTNYHSVEGTNHFTVIDGLTKSDSPIVEKLLDLIVEPEAKIELQEPSERAMKRNMQKFERNPKKITDTPLSQSQDSENKASADEDKTASAEEAEAG